MNSNCWDAIIIGAGVTGSSIAYQLSKRKGKFLVLEEKGDVCEGSSKANSGIAHGGYDAIPGTLKAKMNKEGIALMEEMAHTLDFDYQKIGTLVLCHSIDDRPALEALYERGLQNGTPGMRIVEAQELKAMEPHVADDVVAALLCTEAGIIDPFMLNLGFAEQAAVNSVSFKFYQKVIGITSSDDELWKVRTPTDTYYARAVVNAAGLFSDYIHNMVSQKRYHIKPRKGEYILLDRLADGIVNHVIFDLPTKRGKGILVSPTCDRNVLLGPTAEFLPDKTEVETTQEGLSYVIKSSASMIKDIPYHMAITSFTGNRAHEIGGDFILQESQKGFFDCVGVESPGLTSSPAVGIYMAQMINERLGLPENPAFSEKRHGITKLRIASPQLKEELIKQNPEYAQIICRCEQVSLAEIKSAIHKPLGAKSLDGLKRRVRATAGRCQGGFCTPRLLEILADELGVEQESLTKKDESAYVLIDRLR